MCILKFGESFIRSSALFNNNVRNILYIGHKRHYWRFRDVEMK